MVPHATRLTFFVAVLGLAACGGNAPEPAAPPTPAEPPPAPVLDLATLQGQAQNVALTPSPAEMQASLARHQIGQSLASLVKKRDLQVNGPSKDQVAVRTGVVVAELVLTVREATKEELVARLGRVREGMHILGAGADIEATIEDLVNRIQNDAVTRDTLVQEFDELSGVVIPEIEYEAGPRCVPLIQAGSWLEGANLVSTAVRNAERYDAADALLRQPEVVRYFLQYVRTEGQERAPDEVIQKLEGTLTTLAELTSKPTLTAEDVKTIQVETDSVLALL